MRARIAILVFATLAGCQPSAREDMDRPDPVNVRARQPRPGGEMIVGATASGGGAGDVVFRLLACPTGASKCERVASIDQNGALEPELATEGSKLVLVVNEEDVIAGFNNFSRALNAVGPGQIIIRTRRQRTGH